MCAAQDGSLGGGHGLQQGLAVCLHPGVDFIRVVRLDGVDQAMAGLGLNLNAGGAQV